MRRLARELDGHVGRAALSALIFAAVVLLSGCKIATMRPLDPVTGQAIIEQQTFSAAEYVAQRWESQVIPYAREHAVPLDLLLYGLNTDRAATEERYGVREGTNAWNFLVTGKGTVREVDTSSLMGLMHMDIANLPSDTTISLQIGPVIRGAALRDALPFIDFDQFTNQIEFASVSNELHKRVRDDVLANFDKETAVGKTVTFWGAFTLDNLSNIVITPVILEVGE